MIKKKIGMSLVTVAALATPIATIISCGKTNEKGVAHPKKNKQINNKGDHQIGGKEEPEKVTPTPKKQSKPTAKKQSKPTLKKQPKQKTNLTKVPVTQLVNYQMFMQSWKTATNNMNVENDKTFNYFMMTHIWYGTSVDLLLHTQDKGFKIDKFKSDEFLKEREEKNQKIINEGKDVLIDDEGKTITIKANEFKEFQKYYNYVITYEWIAKMKKELSDPYYKKTLLTNGPLEGMEKLSELINEQGKKINSIKEVKKFLQQDKRLNHFSLEVSFKEETTEKAEGLYLTREFYNGRLGKGHIGKDVKWTPLDSSKNIMELGKHTGWAGTQQQTMQFGDGDSFVVKYNEDDSDGIKPADFLKNLWFYDTGVVAKYHPKVVEWNKEILGLNMMQKKIDGEVPKLTMIPNDSKNTDEGYMPAWIDTDDNSLVSYSFHGTPAFKIQQALYKASKWMRKETFEKIAKYYGYKAKTNDEGVYEEDSTIIANNAKAPKASKIDFAKRRKFFPKFNKSGFWTYERISKRLFKVTFHNSGDVAMVAALWKFGTVDHKKDVTYGPFALGSQNTWARYENRHAYPWRYDIVARKEVFFK
ncbi:hypothetical protein [Mycoplasma todarodis]|uniref:Lipoprotein n=1 Tax=Mycoplasma todarodis TaxID=1937191 RepID=A0A4R0XM40_9MOLU|nr:hypothetical protein [Mycoplasma todarodis]TCG11594.1 hypothetical protein C4B25_01275 [Mycoplasma todarodis]